MSQETSLPADAPAATTAHPNGARPASARSAPTSRVPRRGLAIYLLVAFAVAWALFGLVAVLGGYGSPITGPLLPIAMWAPALGTLAAWAWGGRLPPLGVRRRGPWRWYLLTLVGVPVLIALGMAAAVLAGVQQLDPANSAAAQAARQAGVPFTPPPPEGLVLLAILTLLVGPIFNMLATFGEEVGWRGYLLGALAPLGGRQAALAVGAIWGLWHAPIIVQGHNYPGEPLLGVPCMILLCLAWGVVFAWLRLQSGSVWPAVLAHGALNAQGAAALALLTPANPVLGAPVGVVALLPVIVVAALLLRSDAWDRAAALGPPTAPYPDRSPGPLR